jgi:hypothetical protein
MSRSDIAQSGTLFTAEAIFGGGGYNPAYLPTYRNLAGGVIKPEFSVKCLWRCGKKLWQCKEECVSDFNAVECVSCLGGSWNECKHCF